MIFGHLSPPVADAGSNGHRWREITTKITDITNNKVNSNIPAPYVLNFSLTRKSREVLHIRCVLFRARARGANRGCSRCRFLFFLFMQSSFNRCCFAIYCRGDQEIILQSNIFSVHAVELKNKNKSVGTVSGWHSGSAFGSDTKGRRFKSLKIKDLLCRVDSLQAKPLCCWVEKI